MREFHCYGLLSSEGHESHHGKVHKKTTLLKSVRSHDLRSRRFFGGELALLDQEYARQFAQIKEKRTGKKCGTYKTTHKDATELDHDQFVSTLSMVEFDGKQYFQILNDGGILPEENKDFFVCSIRHYTIGMEGQWGFSQVWGRKTRPRCCWNWWLKEGYYLFVY